MAMALNTTNSISEILKLLSFEETQHMMRVGALVDRFAAKLKSYALLKTQGNEQKYWGKAAFYHDIGKGWIPKNILAKPDRLTEQEMEIIRSHPLLAKKIFEKIKCGQISGIPDYLIPLAADSAIYHHEWWNGIGYPYGIKQDEIPLIARITSICDAYDAMTSKRIYHRKSHTHEYACYELRRCAGTQFDPKLVRIFLSAETPSEVSQKESFSQL